MARFSAFAWKALRDERLMSDLRPQRCDPSALPDHLPPLVRELYASRIKGAHELEKRLAHLLPVEMAGLSVAVARIAQALWAGEPMLIYGDYDVDGACATALMVRVLRQLGGNVGWFVPDRHQHGYGLSLAGVAAARTYHPHAQLWITVDNGMKSHHMASALAEQGIELIITDHHLPEVGEALPQAVAVVNPNRADCTFASKALCGAGVAFYVLCGLQQYLKQQTTQPTLGAHDLKMTQYLDLVALASIADVVPLDYNNRILVEHGLRLLRGGGGNVGIKALLAQANVDALWVSAQDLAFSVAPRLNAAGRMAHMKLGLQLLLCDEWVGAQDLARTLDEHNRARKALENDLLAQAKVAVNPHEPLAFAYLENGHEGVLGILAGRLKALYARPSFVACASFEEGWAKASLRSCYGVALDTLLAEAALSLDAADFRFGGHAMAAGLSVRQSALPTLIAALNQILRRDFGTGFPPEPEWVDGSLSADYLTPAWAKYLELLEPWGMDLPAPVFCNVFEVVEERTVGQQHTRLSLRHPDDGQLYQAMWFSAPVRLPVGAFVVLDYRLAVNRFHNDERLVLHIQRLRPQSALV